MPIRNWTLVACLLVPGAAFGQATERDKMVQNDRKQFAADGWSSTVPANPRCRVERRAE